MAIEQGLTALIAAALASPPCNVPGGFSAQLPKDIISPATPMAWAYRVIVSNATYTLAGVDGLVPMEIQIDCHGLAAKDAITLAALIDTVLSGYRGALPDGTVVQGIFNQGPSPDGYSDANRSFVRSLEYQVNYNQS